MVEEKIQNAVHNFNGEFTMSDKVFGLTTINNLPKENGNADELESFRFSNGYGFPLSYKNFVKEFGYGLTLGVFIIYIPMGDYGDSVFVRSEEIKNTYIDDVLNEDIWFDIEPDATVEIVKRLYPFSHSETGLYLFWDIDSLHNGELDIYITDFGGLGFRKVAKDLYSFIEKLTDKDQFKEYDHFANEPYPSTFEVYDKLC